MRRNRHFLLVLIGMFCLCLAESTPAASFPFRVVEVGQPLPAITLAEADSGKEVEVAANGRGLLLAFVGADLPAKRKRALKALKKLAGLADFLGKRGIAVYVVDAQGGDEDAVRAIVAESGIGGGFYLDPGRQAYGRLGIFVMPSILLVAPDGKIAAGMGYSHDMGRRLKGAVEIMLGEKTPEQVEAELHPHVVRMSKEEAAALRHFHLGRALAAKGQPEMAIKELEKAVAIDARMGKALVTLGCLYLETGDTATAEKDLAAGLALEPDDVSGQICRARIKAAAGAVDEAAEDLEDILFRNIRNPDLHYWLARFHEMKGDAAGAAPEFRKAYELLKRRGLAGAAGR